MGFIVGLTVGFAREWLRLRRTRRAALTGRA
jgi:hypothetical protein